MDDKMTNIRLEKLKYNSIEVAKKTNTSILVIENFINISNNDLLDLKHYLNLLNTNKVGNLLIDLRNNPGGLVLLSTKLYSLISYNEIVNFIYFPLKTEEIIVKLNSNSNSNSNLNSNLNYKMIDHDRQIATIDNTKSHYVLSNNDIPHQPQKSRRFFKGNIYLLISEKCRSTCEIFLEYFKNDPKAYIIGSPTAGARKFIGPQLYTLPNSKIQLSIPSIYREVSSLKINPDFYLKPTTPITEIIKLINSKKFSFKK